MNKNRVEQELSDSEAQKHLFSKCQEVSMELRDVIQTTLDKPAAWKLDDTTLTHAFSGCADSALNCSLFPQLQGVSHKAAIQVVGNYVAIFMVV